MPSISQGVSNDRYTLILRTLIFLTRDEKILLLKGAPNKRLWANCYNGVGGHIEQGEDVITAARRELQEETGIVPKDLWLCGIVTVDTGQVIGIGIFILRGDTSDSEFKTSSEGNLEWIPIDRIQELPLVEDLHIILPKILAMTKGTPPFFAHYSYDQADRLVITFSE